MAFPPTAEFDAFDRRFDRKDRFDFLRCAMKGNRFRRPSSVSVVRMGTRSSWPSAADWLANNASAARRYLKAPGHTRGNGSPERSIKMPVSALMIGAGEYTTGCVRQRACLPRL